MAFHKNKVRESPHLQCRTPTQPAIQENNARRLQLINLLSALFKLITPCLIPPEHEAPELEQPEKKLPERVEAPDESELQLRKEMKKKGDNRLECLV